MISDILNRRWAIALIALLAARPAFARDLEEHFAVWTQRQAAVKTLSIQWNCEVWIAGADAADPGEQFHVEESLRMDAEGRSRVELFNIGRERRASAISSRKMISVFDGNTETHLFEKGHHEYPSAFISAGSPQNVAALRFIAPIFLSIRPLDETFVKDRFRDMVDTQARVDFEGQACAIYDRGPDSVWVTDDPRSLLVRLYRRGERDRRPRSDTQISYVQDNGGWRIGSWKVTGFGVDESQITEIRKAAVTGYRVNDPLPDDTFKVEVPAGAWVTNTIAGTDEIVREGKENRPVAPHEFTGKNYQQLLQSEPDVANQRLAAGDREINWWVWGNVGFLGCLLLLAAVRWLRKA